MMGVTSLEVYKTVYNITNSNNKLDIVLNDQQLKKLNLDNELLVFVEDLYKPILLGLKSIMNFKKRLINLQLIVFL